MRGSQIVLLQPRLTPRRRTAGGDQHGDDRRGIQNLDHGRSADAPYPPVMPAAPSPTASTIERPIVVLGLMGAGKSTLAAALAADLGLPLADSDADITASSGHDAREIARADGVDELHDLEAGHLRAALDAAAPMVVAAAASVVDRPDLRRRLAVEASVLWLDAPSPVLARRIGGGTRGSTRGVGDHRPDYGDPTEVLARQDAARRDHFAAVAHVVLDATAPPQEVLATALRRLREGSACGQDDPPCCLTS